MGFFNRGTELDDLVIEEVSLVDRGANEQPFLVVKNEKGIITMELKLEDIMKMTSEGFDAQAFFKALGQEEGLKSVIPMIETFNKNWDSYDNDLKDSASTIIERLVPDDVLAKYAEKQDPGKSDDGAKTVDVDVLAKAVIEKLGLSKTIEGDDVLGTKKLNLVLEAFRRLVDGKDGDGSNDKAATNDGAITKLESAIEKLSEQVLKIAETSAGSQSIDSNGIGEDELQKQADALQKKYEGCAFPSFAYKIDKALGNV